MKKKAVRLLLLFVTSILIVGILYSYSEKTNHKKNSFIRLMPPHVLDNMRMLDLGFNSYYIAGMTNSKVYLGNSTAPTHLLVTNIGLTDTQHIDLDLPHKFEASSLGYKITVDSPYIYAVNNQDSIFLAGTLPFKNTAKQTIKINNIGRSCPISPSSIILRAYDYQKKKNVLYKETFGNSLNVVPADVLKRQIDGFFCTDGVLEFNKDLNKIIYVYFYRNQFLCLDTNMSLIYEGKTIDTISHAHIKIAALAAQTQNTLASPPLVVNKRVCSSGNYLFVQSLLLANNELKKIFDQGSVIDMYELKTGHYFRSFYLGDFKGEKIQDFKICKNSVAALNGQYLFTYTLALVKPISTN